MMTLNDGRSELWQWDTGRKLTVDAECSQVHFSNKVFGRSIDVDVIDGEAIIPDVLLQTDKDLIAWAFVGTSENGYTKISKVFKVNRRNKPADYVFTPPDQTSLEEIKEKIEYLESIQDPDAIKNAVDDYIQNNPIKVDEEDPTVPNWAKQPTKPIYTASEVGALPADTVIPTIPDNVSAFQNDVGYLTEHQDISGKLDASALPTAINTALAQAKASGEFDGKDGSNGVSPTISVSAITGGHRITITDANGTKTVDIMDGSDGQDGGVGATGRGIKTIARTSGNGAAGTTDTYTITYTDNTTSTFSVYNGKDGATGGDGKDGADGKSAYAYAQEAGYTGTEEEFAKKLASESSGIHVGPDAPTDENVNVWIDTDDEAEKPSANPGGGIDVTAEVGQTIIVEEVDANGNPTKWKAVDYQPRTHYSTYKEVRLLENATVAGDGSSAFDFLIVAGQTYQVIWNGTSYEDVAFNYSLDGLPIQCIGNPGIFMGDDNGKPYFLYSVADMGMTIGMTMDGSDGVITLDVIDETVYKIPQKYVPDMGPYYVFAYIDNSDSMSFVTNETVENFTNAFNSGRAVWLRFANNSGVIFIPLYSTSDGNRTVEFRTYGSKCVFTATDDGGYSMEIEFT